MRRLFPKSLLGQLVLLILFAFVIAQIVSFVLFADERGQAVRNAQSLEAADRAATVTRLVEGASPETRAAVLEAANSRLVRFSVDGEASVSANEAMSPDIVSRSRGLIENGDTREIRAVMEAVSPHGTVNRDLPPPMSWMRDRAIAAGVAPMQMRLSVSLSDGDWLNMVMSFQRPDLQRPPGVALATLLFLAGIVAALWFGLSRITGPLRQLAVAADRLGRGEELQQLPDSGPREVRALSEAFSDMQTRLTRLISERTRMLAALGHDLRSPITALRLRAEMVDDEETRERMATILDEMQDMVEATLSFARGVTSDQPAEDVDLAELLTQLAKECSESGPPIHMQPARALHLRLHRTPIRRAIRNVLENAQRDGGGAEMRLVPGESYVRIVIEDNGPGIPSEELERVFDPFVRLEASRSRETGGTGLGLSIARTILHAHGGEIELANRPEGGLVVTMTLPMDSREV